MKRTEENTSISTNCRTLYFEIREVEEDYVQYKNGKKECGVKTGMALIPISKNQYRNLGPKDRHCRVEYE